VAVSRRISAQRRSISIVKCKMQSFSGSRATGTVILHPSALQGFIVKKTSKIDFCIPSVQNPVARCPEPRISHCRLRVLKSKQDFFLRWTHVDAG
jgi:hypothetical protein